MTPLSARDASPHVPCSLMSSIERRQRKFPTVCACGSPLVGFASPVHTDVEMKSAASATQILERCVDDLVITTQVEPPKRLGNDRLSSCRAAYALQSYHYCARITCATAVIWTWIVWSMVLQRRFASSPWTILTTLNHHLDQPSTACSGSNCMAVQIDM
jgi:hypothetical protein